MDPNANLRGIRYLISSIKKAEADQWDGYDPAAAEAMATHLAEIVEALDEWITRGGFLPSDWKAS